VAVSWSKRGLIGAAFAAALAAGVPVEATAGSWSGHGQVAATTQLASGAGDAKRVTLRASRRFVFSVSESACSGGSPATGVRSPGAWFV
jgi:hypothetical protein